jgi:hypothetical protein
MKLIPLNSKLFVQSNFYLALVAGATSDELFAFARAGDFVATLVAISADCEAWASLKSTLKCQMNSQRE